MKRSLLLIFVLFCLPWILYSQSITWEQLDGLHSGNIHSMVADEDGNLYVNVTKGSGYLGPYKSTDGGASWTSISTGLIQTKSSGVYNPMIITTNGSLFLANTPNNYISTLSYVYRSTDGGNYWTTSFTLLPYGDIRCILDDPEGNIYIGTSKGLYKSSDNGDNWARYGTFDKEVIAMVINADGHVFVAQGNSVYRSVDDGANWIKLPTSDGIRTLAIKSDGTLFAGGAMPGGISRSSDNGDSWQYVYPQTVSIQQASTVFIDINGDIYFPTQGKGVMKSSDNGDSWFEFSTGLSNKDASVITKNINGDFFAGSNSAIFKSTDGCANWYSVGLNTFRINAIAINQNNDIFAALEQGGICLSTDGGISWKMSYPNPYTTPTLAISENTGSIFSCGTEYEFDSGLLSKSTDNGNSWSRSDNGFPHDDYGNSVNALAVNSLGHVFAFGSIFNRPYGLKSTDDGESWFFNTEFGNPDGKPAALAVNSAGDLFLATTNNGIWRLLQGEYTWTMVTDGSFDCLHIGRNGFVYASKKRSTDNGETWTTMNITANNISSYAENSLGHLFCGSKSDYAYAGKGVIRSTDYGNTWENIKDGLANCDIHSLAVDSDDYLYAGTWGSSVFRTMTSTVDNNDIKPPVSDDVKLYPNPAKETVWVSGTDKLDGNKEINIYDLNGRLLIQKHFSALTEVIELDVRSLKRGIYFCRINAQDLSITKKMIIQR